MILGLGLAVGLLAWGLPYFAKTSWHDILAVVRTVPWTQATFFQALMLLGLWSYTFTFTGSLPGLSHKRALTVNLCGSSVSRLVPGGGAVGLAATYAICRSWGFSNRAVSTSAVVTGVWNVLARIALPVAAIITLWWDDTGLPRVLTDAAVGAGLTGLALLGTFVAVLSNERAAQAVGRGLDRLLSPLMRRARRTRSMSISALVHDMRARIGDVVRTGWLQMTLGMVGFFGTYYVLFVLIMRATGVSLDLRVLFAAFAIGRLVSSVGITPGGIGITETATAAALVGWGADPAAATAGVVLFSIFTNFMEIPLGGIGWMAWSLSTKARPPPPGTEASAA